VTNNTILYAAPWLASVRPNAAVSAAGGPGVSQAKVVVQAKLSAADFSWTQDVPERAGFGSDSREAGAYGAIRPMHDQNQLIPNGGVRGPHTWRKPVKT
jgi:hypothetical protein